jgi:hypothetical protein
MNLNKIEQDYILLIMNCKKYKVKANEQKKGWLQQLPQYLPYYHVIGDPDLQDEYVFNNYERTLYVRTEDDYISLPKKVIAAFYAIRETYRFKYIFKTDDDQILQNNNFFNIIVKLIEEKTVKMKIHYGGKIINVEIPYMSKYFLIHPELPEDMILKKTEYCSGRFYFLSSEAVTNLILKRKNVEKEFLEDYAIGLNLNSFFKTVMLPIESDKYFKDSELNLFMDIKNPLL